jgi:uncharacterized phage-like protein YoqJ
MIDFKYMMSEESKVESKRKREEEKIQQELLESNRLKTCAFTGHRPDKLGGHDWRSQKNIDIGNKVLEQIEYLINEHNVTRFICGGALGIDQMAFSICSKLKETKYPNLYLILAMPFEKQDAAWINEKDKVRLKKQREKADEVILVDELKDYRYKVNDVPVSEYHPAKMQKRNEWMVDNCNYLIAVWDRSKGGTANCVNYFNRQIGSGRMIIRIDPNSLESEISYR